MLVNASLYALFYNQSEMDCEKWNGTQRRRSAKFIFFKGAKHIESGIWLRVLLPSL